MSIFQTNDRFQQLLTEVQQAPTAAGHAAVAQAYNLRSDYNRAIEHARTAIRMDQFQWDAWYELVLASGFKNYSELENIKNQLESFLESPEKDNPVQPGLYRDLALINYFLEQDVVATSLIERAIEHQADDSRIYEVRGYVEHAGTDFQRALKSFARAVELNPDCCRSMRMIGKCYMDQGMMDKGLVKLEQALRLEPCFVAAWHLLGEYYLENGELLLGLQSFARARSINTSRPWWPIRSPERRWARSPRRRTGPVRRIRRCTCRCSTRRFASGAPGRTWTCLRRTFRTPSPWW